MKTRVRKELSWKSVGRAEQLQYMKTENFSEYAGFRNGVEAIPALLRRRYHVLRLVTTNFTGRKPHANVKTVHTKNAVIHDF